MGKQSAFESLFHTRLQDSANAIMDNGDNQHERKMQLLAQLASLKEENSSITACNARHRAENAAIRRMNDRLQRQLDKKEGKTKTTRIKKNEEFRKTRIKKKASIKKNEDKKKNE